MATSYTWRIAQLDRETADGYVYTAHWNVSARDDAYSAGAYGSVPFERPETLVPFADLTQDQVIGWVQEKLGGAEKVAEIQAALQRQIDEQRAPTRAQGMPWQ